jgi:UDP-N-acetylmuramoyl-tripeptide--D-alanyl-D-alanine ligase
MKLSLEQIARWTGGELLPRHGAVREGCGGGYSIDTRTLQPGDVFFAIRGERFDAHEFVTAAFERRACAAVVDKLHAVRLAAELQGGAREHCLVAVDDPLIALQMLAAAVRRHWGKRVIAVTGSAGKTTTKDMIAAVLETRFRVRKSAGNLNNHFGLPLQLLKLEPEDEVAVLEMGMSAAGEIAALARIAAPDWGVVTNVGMAHAEGFADGQAGIARAKYELVAGLPRRGVAFLNADDAYVSQFGRDFHGKAIYYGTTATAQVRAEQIEEQGAEGTRFRVVANGDAAEVSLALLGRHSVLNALAAMAVAREAGIPLEVAAAALEQMRAGEKRGEVVEFAGAKIINDCYNSNPEALRSMIAVLAAMPADRRILVAGEMLELGPESAALHAACGRAAAEAGVDWVIGVRGLAAALVEAARQGGARVIFAEAPEQAGRWLKEHVRAGDAVLLKASRGVRLERALEGLRGHGAAR